MCTSDMMRHKTQVHLKTYFSPLIVTMHVQNFIASFVSQDTSGCICKRTYCVYVTLPTNR